MSDFANLLPQPDIVSDPLSLKEFDGERYASIVVKFYQKPGEQMADTLLRADQWAEEQRKVLREINSWVDEELVDYPEEGFSKRPKKDYPEA